MLSQAGESHRQHINNIIIKRPINHRDEAMYYASDE